MERGTDQATPRGARVTRRWLELLGVSRETENENVASNSLEKHSSEEGLSNPSLALMSAAGQTLNSLVAAASLNRTFLHTRAHAHVD